MLHVAPETGAARMRARPGDADRYERMDPAFHARVAAGFAAIAAADPARCRVVEANGDLAAVHAAIMAAVHSC